MPDAKICATVRPDAPLRRTGEMVEAAGIEPAQQPPPSDCRCVTLRHVHGAAAAQVTATVPHPLEVVVLGAVLAAAIACAFGVWPWGGGA